MTRWKWILALVAVLILGCGGYYYYETQLKIIPEELIEEALAKTLGTKSYRYHVELTMYVDNRPLELSRIQGEKANDKDFHIKGTMQEQEVEVYQLDNNTYLKDAVSGKWLVIPENSVFETEYFLAEINPLSSFNFTHLENLQYLGVEKIDGKKYYVFTCTPGVNNEFLNRYWQDFQYKLWVEKNSRKLTGAEVKATNKAKPTDSLTMLVKLWDFDAPIELSAPVD